MFYFLHFYATVVQPGLEREFHKLDIAGSNPASGIVF